MRRLIICGLVAALSVPALVAVPRGASAEPNWCAGLRKKAHLERWEFEAFNKACTAAAQPPARKGAPDVPAERSVLSAGSLLGEATAAAPGTPASTPLTAPLGAVPDKNGLIHMRPADAKLVKATIETQTDNLAAAKKNVADKVATGVATASAITSTNAARSADQRLSICRYKVNWLSFVAGLTSLARAPKIRDTTQLLSIAAPLPFSTCDKAVDAATAPLVVPASIGLVEGGDAVRLHILEAGYTGSFAVTPADGGILSIDQVLDVDKKTVLRDQFDVKAIKFVDSTTLKVQDESGAIKEIHVNIKKAS